MVDEMFGMSNLLQALSSPSEADKLIVCELAVAAMEELVKMAQSGEPLWVPTSDINSLETLNEQVYSQTFPRGIGPKLLELKSEASRESAVVIMNHINLVEILMNVVLSGEGDPHYVALLPSGFAILPDGPETHHGGRILEVGNGGCLLTVAFQILVDSVTTEKVFLGSVETVKSLVKHTVAPPGRI